MLANELMGRGLSGADGYAEVTYETPSEVIAFALGPDEREALGRALLGTTA